MPPLTDEQRLRIEANKAAALAKRAASTPPSRSPPAAAAAAAVAVPAERCRRLNFAPPRSRVDGGTHVLLWVQSAQRASHNEALELACARANVHGVPVVAVFGGTAWFPGGGSGARHLRFMYEGLCELEDALARTRGVRLLGFAGEVPDVVIAASRRAVEVVTDAGYTRTLRRWREKVAGGVQCATTEVECDVVAPLYAPGGGAGRGEPAAATLRPKIWPRLEALASREVTTTTLALAASGAEEALELVGGAAAMAAFPRLPFSDGADACLEALHAASGGGVDFSVPPCPGYHAGGEAEAHRKLEVFLSRRLDDYASKRNDPGLGLQSHLSPHIHYGQISVVYVTRRALEVKRRDPRHARSVDVFLDELVIRRELAINFVLNNPKYDSYDGLPRWARITLADHAGDARRWSYTREEFERGLTHDALWNAAQRELLTSGKQHNYVRMYWAKKILEWSEDPTEAWRVAIELNNKYSLDGRDPSSYTGVGWCFGLHDKPFPETQIVGTLRRMSENGMRGKFNAGLSSYLARWSEKGPRGGIRGNSTAAEVKGGGGGGGGSSTPAGKETRQRRLEEMFFKPPPKKSKTGEGG